MITKWIVQAVCEGREHLELDLNEVARWQRNGCDGKPIMKTVLTMRALRKSDLWLTQAAFAEQLGMSMRTFIRCEIGGKARRSSYA